jgi:endonuclease/exonuclease/phosphatase family metal-dependent hydrolase
MRSRGFNDLKILTWNIYMLPYCSWINGNLRRARTIAQNLSKSGYDIILFEEAFDHLARRILKKQLKYSYPYIYGPANRSGFSFRTNSGLWVLSKIPLRHLEEIEFEFRFGIDALARKGAVMFEGEWHEQKFQLVCAHLQADSPDILRREQCREMAERLLKKHTKEQIPQIICGDFNIEIDDKENYEYMLTTLESQNGNIDGGIQISYDEIDNELAKEINGKKRLIDYILVRNAKSLFNITRHVSVIKGHQNNNIYNLSDHYGIEACINFNTF